VISEQEIYTRLTTVFRDVFDDETLAPTAETTADDVEEWDSLSHIRLVLSVEREFGVQFSTVELGNLKQVGDLANLVSAKLSS
jgi:acyl carrier protein